MRTNADTSVVWLALKFMLQENPTVGMALGVAQQELSSVAHATPFHGT